MLKIPGNKSQNPNAKLFDSNSKPKIEVKYVPGLGGGLEFGIWHLIFGFWYL